MKTFKIFSGKRTQISEIKIQFLLVSILLIQVFGLISAEADTSVAIAISATDPGRPTEGIGTMSAGATSRFFKDYPAPVKDEIIDYLFGPNGARLNHYKMENGGDSNSTCGSQPPIARSRAELTTPTVAYFNRGYEFEIAKKAKIKNPNLRLEALQWCAPGWVGAGITGGMYDQFFSQNNIDYIIGFLKGAKTYHNLDFNYVGTWNEMWRPDAEGEEPVRQQQIQWIIDLRAALNAQGLSSVKINAPDAVVSFDFASYLNPANPRYNAQLDAAVTAIGAHGTRFMSPDQSAEAILTGKILVESEAWEKLRGQEEYGQYGPTPWHRARIIGKEIIENYVDHKITLTDIWEPMDAFYNTNGAYNNGFLTADEPWSGHFYIEPVLWVAAHMTQFTQVGATAATSWQYLDTGCNRFQDSAGNGGSYVTLRSHNTNSNGKYEYSIVLQTFELTEPVDFTVALASNLENSYVYGWHSNAAEQLVYGGGYDAVPDTDGNYTVRLDPGQMYTLTSWNNGQGKKTEPVIANSRKFPFPYTQNFNAVTTGSTTPYMADQEGAFEVVGSGGVGNTKCLKQLNVYRDGPYWAPFPSTYTIVGDQLWEDYRVSCAVKLNVANGHAALLSRYTSLHDNDNYWSWSKWYELLIYQNGSWELNRREVVYPSWNPFKTPLASGSTPSGFVVNGWNTLKIDCIGDNIKAYVGAVQVANVTDTNTREVEVGRDEQGNPIYGTLFPIRRGMVGLETDYNVAYFDNLSVTAAAGGTAYPSGSNYTAAITKLNHPTLMESRNDFTGWVGMQITIGANPITVRELGRYFLTGNQGYATVSVIDSLTETQISTAYINMGQGLPNTDTLGFLYEAVDNPVTLLPGQTYYIASYEYDYANKRRWLGGGNLIPVVPHLESTTALSIDDAIYYDDVYGWWPIAWGPGYCFGPLSFKYN